jgi:hypothetical protein
MTDRSDFLEIDGKRFETRWIGAPSSEVPTLVFLHEGLGSVALWKDFPDRLAAAVVPALIYSRSATVDSDPAPLPRPVSFLEDEARACCRGCSTPPRSTTRSGRPQRRRSIALLHAATFRPGRAARCAP